MPKILSTKEHQDLEEKFSGKMFLTLTKVRQYELKPYGKFVFKWKIRGYETPNQIVMDELRIDYSEAMPMTESQEKAVVKMMKQYKTDVLTDGNEFFTRTNSGLTPISHKKLVMYKTDEAFKIAVDDGHSFGKKD